MTEPLTWTIRTIDELSAHELHALLKLRVDVFVVEQACAYPEVDDLDALPDTLHLLVHSGTTLVGTARAMAPVIQDAESSTTPSETNAAARIGRVAVHADWRGMGVARQMMLELMREIESRCGQVPVEIGAQTAVVDFYKGLGFEVTSKPYLEDGIEHMDMVCPANGGSLSKVN